MSDLAPNRDWIQVAFGDVVRQVSDTVNVKESGLQRFVAGEHMDTDDLRIRRWGVIGDAYLGPAFHMRFRPGQVLYGSRRTYLRKVAVADFEGICANTTFVIETTDPSVLLPGLLPFIMQTRSFQEYSIKQSKGSVNPYINFSDLAQYVFALPPMRIQEQLLEVLQMAETFGESLFQLQRKVLDLLESLSEHVYSKFDCSKQIRDACEINPDTLTNSQLSSDHVWEYLDLSSVEFPSSLGNLTRFALSEAPSRARRIAINGDVLVSTVRPNLRGHTMIRERQKPLVASTGFTVLRPRKLEFSPMLLGLVLSSRFLHHCESRVTGTSYPAVRPTDIGDFQIPDLSVLCREGFFRAFSDTLLAVEQSRNRLRQFAEFCRNLRERLLPP